MNKKGSVYAAFLLAMIIFFVGMIAVNFIMPNVTQAKTDVGCTSPETDGAKLLCLVLDSAVIYFIWLVLSVMGGILLDKFLI